ncbi:MAG: Ldh family oxidoreductase [Candidatus Latescibacteria bacterium]|nr:Ldh family oxidoreductase [Candidatus Latescibacterota bacterium]
MGAGCIGFSVQGYVGRHGRGDTTKVKLGYYGNPPLSFAIPSGSEPPVVLDVATCILADYQRGPEFEELFSKIPAAFFKSIGYGAVANLLGGNLTGAHLPQDEKVAERWPRAQQGGMVLAIHMNSVIPEEVFCLETDRMVQDVRERYEPMPGTDHAFLPGAIEEERFQLHRREGIRYGETEQDAAREVSKRLGVPLPWDE